MKSKSSLSFCLVCKQPSIGEGGHLFCPPCDKEYDKQIAALESLIEEIRSKKLKRKT